MTHPLLGIYILAAGFSRRLAKPKQLIDYHGQPLLRHVIKTALTAQGGPVSVVVHDRSSWDSVITGLDVHLLVNPNASRGMGTSIKLAVQDGVDKGLSAYLLMVGDQPFMTTTHLASLIATWRSRNDAVVATRYPEGQLGIPCVFPAVYQRDLLDIQDDHGAKGVIQRALTVEALSVAAEALFDVDTPEDEDRFRRALARDGMDIQEQNKIP